MSFYLPIIASIIFASIIFALIFIILIVMSESTNNARERKTFTICIILIILGVCLFMGSRLVAYDEGQMDALNGKQKFTLVSKVIEVQQTVKKTIVVPMLK